MFLSAQRKLLAWTVVVVDVKMELVPFRLELKALAFSIRMLLYTAARHIIAYQTEV